MSELFSDIGNRLKAYRLGRGMPPEALADKIGVSRAALYRYEKGIPPKLETLDKISNVLEVSLPSLLGVGIEYISSCVSFIERMRQIELETKHISVMFGPISYLLTSDAYDDVLRSALLESLHHQPKDPAIYTAEVNQICALLKQRKQNYKALKPNILSLVSSSEIQRFVQYGFTGKYDLPADTIKERQKFAEQEVQHIIDLMEEQPIGVQLGILVETIPNSSYQIFRQPNRDLVAISPFKLGDLPNISIGVAMITGTPEAVELHSNITEQLWSRSLKGYHAIDHIKNKILGTRRNPL